MSYGWATVFTLAAWFAGLVIDANVRVGDLGLSKKFVSDATIISRSFSMYRWTNLRSLSVMQHRLDEAKIRKISRKILKKLGVVHQMPESSF